MDPQQLSAILALLQQSGSNPSTDQSSGVGMPTGGSLAPPSSTPMAGNPNMASPGGSMMGSNAQNPYQFLNQQPPMQQGMLGQ